MHANFSSRPTFRGLMLAVALLTALSSGLAACSTSDSDDRSDDRGGLGHKGGSQMERSIPVGLRIPAVKVNAGRMIKLGVDEDGNLQVPPTGKEKRPGWYSHSVTPGENGVSVLVARFNASSDSALLQKGSFLKVGDDIQVKRSDGDTVTFVIREVEQRNGKSIAATSLDLESKQPELLLINPSGALTKKVTHHETGEGGKEAGDDVKSNYYYNIVFYADLKQGAAGK